MAYSHTKTKDITPHSLTEDAGFVIKGWPSMSGQLKKMHPHWVDDIPVNKNTYDFALALRRFMPKVKFGIQLQTNDHLYTHLTSHGVADVGRNKVVFDELLVYIPGQRYVLGRIGFKDYGVNEYCPAYGVMSRKIRQKRVQKHHDKHNMNTSENLNRIVKSALATLVPYSIYEEGEQTWQGFKDSVKGVAEETSKEYRTLIQQCASFSVVEKEIRNLLRQGVSFITPEFIKASQELGEAETSLNETQMRKVRAYYVSLRDENGVLKADVVMHKSDIKSAYWPSTTSIQAEFTTVTAEDLPDDLRAKLAVLMTVADGSYTPRIGQKIDDMTYWLEQEVSA
jgi:hypothetical protein